MSATDKVPVTLSLTGIEALAAFLAQHERLWNATASECGVADPSSVPLALAHAHAFAVERLAVETPKTKRRKAA